MEKISNFAACLLLVFVIASCQKVAVDDVDGNEEEQGQKSLITFRINQIEQTPFSSSEYSSRATSITKLCSHIFLAVYKSDGERLTTKSQNSSDKDFGKLSVSLAKGTYRIVLLAYNQKDNPTAPNAEKIVFGNNGKMTDTFLWSDEITVENNLEKDISMKRAVAMFRLITTDNIPANVTKMKFYYTGGSSTLNAITGIGNANSKQEENLTVAETGKPGTFEVYTFPKDDENVLKIEVTALDANGNTVASRTFEDVPISRNKITQYKGEFFTGSGSGNVTITFTNLTTDDEWSIIDKSF